MTDTSIDQQTPPHPKPDTAPVAKEKRGAIPRSVSLRRLRAWLRFFRIRLAQAILLPELGGGEAQQMRQTVHDDGALTSGYVLMCALSAGIATLGLLQSSTAVVIGAMLISPLMNPIAALGFGFASIDGKRMREALKVVAVGAGIGILTGVLLTWLSPIRNATPEILARTQPTLLDLAVALFSGIAGGYATVIGKGGTAIGVAIATALMPPLAVLGYGIGVLNIRFALGALLLFLTNLAAITFSFALIARLSGAARPLYKVEWRPRFIAVFVAALLGLAIPLSLSLYRITQEATMRSAATSAIIEACGGKNVDVTQIVVTWPMFDDPTVDALVIAPTYTPNAEETAEKLLAAKINEEVSIHLQQIQAADLQSQTRAIVDAAMERTAQGIAVDVPPFDRIRASIGLPTRAIWTNRAERRVYVEPIPAPGWSLLDYSQVELRANEADSQWNVRIIPPPQPVLRIDLSIPPAAGAPKQKLVAKDAIPPELAGWALLRWGMDKVSMDAPAGERTQAFIKGLKDAGIEVSWTNTSKETDDRPRQAGGAPPEALIRVYQPSPTAVAAAAAKAAAAAARAEQEASAEP